MNREIILSIDRKSLNKIEYILSNIPEEYLQNQCTNSSQQEYYKFLRSYYHHLSVAISNYFSGKPLFEEVNIEQKRYIELDLEKWLCFYNLIQWGWEYVLLEAPRQQWEIDCTPGELFQRVLCNHAESQLSQHQADYLEFIPSKIREQLTIIPRLEALYERLIRNEKITKDDTKLVNRMYKSMQKGEPVKPELDQLFNFCNDVFKKYKNKPRIKHRYSEYLRIQGELEAAMLRGLHPRNHPQGWKIVNQKLHATS